MRFFRPKVTKFIALYFAISILSEAIMPSVAFALTSGPKSPDFMSFTPVATTNMVDLGSGNFNYNIPVVEIPGPDGGGYSLSLAYNSGVNSEQEASWVGFGWSLNPGSIDRNLRGIPDDSNGDNVTYYNKTRPNWSISSTANIGGIEAFSVDIPLSAAKTYQYNNHFGVKNTATLGFSKMGLGLNLNLGTNGITFTPNIDPGQMLASSYMMAANSIMKQCVAEVVANGNSPEAIRLQNLANDKYETAGKWSHVSFGLFTYSDVSRATTYKYYKGFDISFSTSLQVNPGPVPIGVVMGATGNINAQFYDYKSNVESYGYLHSVSAPPFSAVDYYTEKAGSNNKRDMFIGMPFSNPDIFSVSGEGVTGGFRAHRSGPIDFDPIAVGKRESITGKVGAGLEFMVGLDIGVGFNLQFGLTTNSLNRWSHQTHAADVAPVFFRFNNDMGGSIDYDDGSKLVTANIGVKPSFSGLVEMNLDETKVFNPKVNKEKINSSSFIDYKTYGELRASNLIQNNVGSNTNPSNSSIAEFSLYTNNGDNYVYGEPVLNRNDVSLSFDVATSDEVVNNYLALRNVPIMNTNGEYSVNGLYNNENKTVVGEVRAAPMVGSYLLSRITKPNYIDVNSNGPDDIDFGGWTKFEYKQAYGSATGKWYRYRSPYLGLLYNRNTISDIKDDVGSISTGEKEVRYLKVIETKTHIAFFVTNKYRHDAKYRNYNVENGSNVKRCDGFGAKGIDKDTIDACGNPTGQCIGDDLERLERIVVFSKARPEKPLKTVRFEYNYTLVPGLPNNSETVYNVHQGSGTVNERTGRLTLTRIWFEYDGISNAKISPYEFFYSYEKSENIAEECKQYFEEYDKYSDIAGGAQNPAYAPELLDPWGSLMPFGKARKRYEIPWIYQGDNISVGANLKDSWRAHAMDQSPFDPAAWHLKRIKLPSGGEIHIQYEQKDYAYVQDRPVMAMASLIAAENSYSNSTVDINVDDLGCDPTSKDAVYKLKDIIERYYASSKKKNSQELEYANKVYFKFLYSLIGGNPSLQNPSSEYVTGYSALHGVSIVPDPATSEGPYAIRLTLSSHDASGGEQTVVPRKGAADFYFNQRQGVLPGESVPNFTDKDGTFDQAITDIANTTFDETVLFNLSWGMAKAFNPLLMKGLFASWNTNKYDVATELSPALSFVKLPMYRSKRGGGVRVKRLLMYDSGIERGDARVFGQQYRYVQDDGVTSSGVATNEPVGAREENPIIQYMVRKDQSEWSRLTVGEDVTQTEGPLGESLLPSASVNYSRVVVDNIHSESGGNGFTVHEFYTTKDYPFDRKYLNNIGKLDTEGAGVGCSNLSDNSTNISLPEISVFGFSFKYEQLWMAQGFRFILNSMNSLPKRTSAYGGDYIKPDGIIHTRDTDMGYLVSMQSNEYYEPGEKVTLLKPNEIGGYTSYSSMPGKEEEIVSENKKLEENSMSIGLDTDVSVGFPVIPVPFCSLFVNQINIGYQSIATHATTRVVRYPAILKAETFYSDGVYSRKEYLEFDEATGTPLLTKSYDGYYKKSTEGTGEVYQLSVPAYWKYPEMGAKSKNKEINTNQLDAKTMEMVTYGNRPNPVKLSAQYIDNVVAASVTTYSRDWINSWSDLSIKKDYGIPDITNDKYKVNDNLKLIWRPQASYVYKNTESQEANLDGKRVYERGFSTIKNFDWSGNVNDSWIKVSEVLKYSPNGDPLEEIDAMGIPSAVKYGKQYGYCLPVMVGNNASHADIYFNDFEGMNGTATTVKAHSGKGVGACSASTPLIPAVTLTSNLKKKGILLKFWASVGLMAQPELRLKVGDMTKEFTAKHNATCGLWSLYECVVPSNDLSGVSIPVEFYIIGGGEALTVDDVRFQPLDAKATCNVYDSKTFKLLAQFNDDHFGLYYAYNSEGELTHKIIETERGVKTVQEQQHNMPKVIRHVVD